MKRFLLYGALVGAIGILLVGLGLYALGSGALGHHEGPGEITDVPIPTRVVVERSTARARAAEGARDKSILFGDLHVHTTFSSDAFVMSLPLVLGEGAHPPADACDFARHCAALDFWSINDHAESLTPAHWQETIDSVRQCNAVGSGAEPDVTAFLGWEWTQDGTDPGNHWGHKNVVLKGLDDRDIPARPIGAEHPDGDIVTLPPLARAGLALLTRDRRTLDFTRFLEESASLPPCPPGRGVRQLPLSCREATPSPEGLFARLDDWGVEALVIPHGTAWGNTAPPGASWDAQVGGSDDDPKRQRLVEVYSGHGNSEEYRDFVAHRFDAEGRAVCPPPLPGPSGFLPNCWRAGEIIRERCLAEGSSERECEQRAETARVHHVAGGKTGFRTVPGARVEDWLDSGQCRDCFLPAFDYRPKMSAQYMLVRRNFEAPVPVSARLGFIASSDNHTARPGTGYKEVNRSEMTESQGPRKDAPDLLGGDDTPRSHSVSLAGKPPNSFATRDVERMSSFLTTGGLVAVHAENRGREAIWDALKEREVYGTSGERILLWFDLLNPPGGARETLPMGSEVTLGHAPRFRVRAVGAWEQRPGCPDFARRALGPERLHALCRDECYRPGDKRRAITRIEVVRLIPQANASEPVGELIADPWLSLACAPDPSGCTVEFADPDFPDLGRTAAYYVRAIQEATPAVNGANLRCKRDERGECLSLDPCHGGDARTAYEDDCLAEIEERAWSSPIWIDPPPPSGRPDSRG